jgi:hypothetical protein
MKLPTLRRFARATSASLVLALLSTAPALAQDCWLPDAFEPNDVVPTPIGPGLHSGLAVNVAGVGTQADVDRFLITIPPGQRLTLDFAYVPTPGNLSAEQFPIRGTIESQGGAGGSKVYTASGDGPDTAAFFDNPHPYSLNVVVETRLDWHSFVGCRRYDLAVALSARPCDTLPDDALEGPDDCATGTVLQPGLHEDLIVFNELRTAGRDADHYRILDVQPGNAFEIHALHSDGSLLPIHMEVHEDAGCTTANSSSHTHFIENTTNAPRDYYLRVWTTDPSGFERYALQLDWLPCAGAVPDRFEPNGICGPFTPLSAGPYQEYYNGLSIGPGDVDGFEVTVPAGHWLTTGVVPHASDAWLRIVGASAPACPSPASGGFRNYSWFNASNTSVVQRFAVYAPAGFCGAYGMHLSVEPLPCSTADILRNEPNDDCSTATVIPMRLDEHQQLLQTSWFAALDDGDVDAFRVVVPAESAYLLTVAMDNGGSLGITDEPAIELHAFLGGNCAATPLRAALPSWSASGDVWGSSELYMLLPNRSALDVEYVLQLSSPESIVGCQSYHMWLTPEPGWYLQPSGTVIDPTCEAATPVRDGGLVRGTLAPGRPVRGSIALEPGETLTAYLDGSAIRSSSARMHLSLHDGRADCATGGASLGSLTIDPLDLSAFEPYEQFALTHTNLTGESQRVIVECALDDQASMIRQFQDIHVVTDRSPPYSSYCVPDHPSTHPLGCPCDNPDHRTQFLLGCKNSTGVGGRLMAVGSNLTLDDDLVLQVDGLPAHSIGVVFHDGTFDGIRRSFHDGLLCVGPESDPLWVFATDSTGRWTAPGPTSSAIAAIGSSTFRSHLQAWYRDANGPCGAGSNTTNAIRIEWE